jgi:hypothetical protein
VSRIFFGERNLRRALNGVLVCHPAFDAAAATHANDVLATALHARWMNNVEPRESV